MTLSLRRANCVFTLGNQQKTVPYARLRLDPQTWIKPVRWPSASAPPQLNQFYNQNFKKKNQKFKIVMLPEKKHPYPKLLLRQYEGGDKKLVSHLLSSFKNLFCKNVPLLASFILSSKKMFFLRLEKSDSSHAHSLKKWRPLLSSKSFLQKNGGKISLCFLRFVYNFWQCSIFFLSISEKKKCVFLFVAVKKNARFQKMRESFSQCWWAPDFHRCRHTNH